MIGGIQTRTVEKSEQIGLFVLQMLRQPAVRRISIGFLQQPILVCKFPWDDIILGLF